MLSIIFTSVFNYRDRNVLSCVTLLVCFKFCHKNLSICSGGLLPGILKLGSSLVAVDEK